MSIFREVLNQAGLEFIKGYTIINYDGKALYVEGIEKILLLADEKILVLCNKKIIEITGTQLCVKQIEQGSIIICGNIGVISEDKNG